MGKINKGQGKNNSNNNRTKCQNCGNFHKKDACWAKNQRCNTCHKVGHFSKVCQERQQGAAIAPYTEKIYSKTETQQL